MENERNWDLAFQLIEDKHNDYIINYKTTCWPLFSIVKFTLEDEIRSQNKEEDYKIINKLANNKFDKLNLLNFLKENFPKLNEKFPYNLNSWSNLVKKEHNMDYNLDKEINKFELLREKVNSNLTELTNYKKEAKKEHLEKFKDKLDVIQGNYVSFLSV